MRYKVRGVEIFIVLYKQKYFMLLTGIYFLIVRIRIRTALSVNFVGENVE